VDPVGLDSFGGPAGQIAVMHRMLVDERRRVSEVRFLHALNYCMLLPGPDAQQLIAIAAFRRARPLPHRHDPHPRRDGHARSPLASARRVTCAMS
jgi:hypothetical protein